MANFLSSNPIVLAVAAELGARKFGTASDFERDAECGTCGFEGEMEFTAEGFEEAVAECPECSDRVEIYTGA